MRTSFIHVAYIGASVLFILGLRNLTRPEKARRGMHQAAFGMLLAVAGTLVNHEILDYKWIAIGMGIGAVLGYPLGMWMPMTAMPQRITLALSFSALAATLLGIAEYHTGLHGGEAISHAKVAALGFEVLLGSITVTGTLVAAGKLRDVITSKSVTYAGQNLINGVLFAFTLGLFAFLVLQPESPRVFYLMIGLASVVGILFVMPIGGADMMVVVALLNSCAGLAACAAGFAIHNEVLIIAGALAGASGFVLSLLMSKAMNRSLGNVLFGALGSQTLNAEMRAVEMHVRSVNVQDAAIQLAYAQRVIIVPGYGMAVSQAQHQVRELAELIERRGGEVKYAIHPVAGRLPGHMDVLLAEAKVPYDKLFDIEEINGEFERADVAMVVGANDVINPAARTDEASPIYGMPILNVDKANSIIVLKRSMAAGFAGIENELFYDPKTSMLFGDAKTSLTALIGEMRERLSLRAIPG